MSLTKALRNVGIMPGDSVLVHSDVSSLSNHGGSLKSVLENVLSGVSAAVGLAGSVLVPTFNYDFCDGKPYHHEESKSQVGLFSEWVRTRPGSIRSFHPIFSFAGFGPIADELLDVRSNSSFGPGSVFENLYNKDAKILFLNVPFESCTFVHFVEQCVGIEYRFLKQFTGKVTRENRSWNDSFDFYVRYMDRTVDTYFGRLEQQLRDSDKLRSHELDSGQLLLTTSKAVFKAASAMIADDPYSLLKTPPVRS